MELEYLTTQIPESQPKLRIYEHYVSLNAPAVRLLGLNDQDHVQFARPTFCKFSGVDRFYICKAKNIVGAYLARKRKRCVRISNRELARYLAEKLDGIGCYRICPEDKIEYMGSICYNVFFKNYDKKDSD